METLVGLQESRNGNRNTPTCIYHVLCESKCLLKSRVPHVFILYVHFEKDTDYTIFCPTAPDEAYLGANVANTTSVALALLKKVRYLNETGFSVHLPANCS